MDFEIVELDQLNFVGFAKTVSTVNGKNFEEIPKMWQKFGEKQLYQKLIPSDEFGIVGLCYDWDHASNQFKYMIGIRTTKALEGFEQVSFPKQKFVKFKAVGPLPTSIQNVVKEIYSTWLPQSAYVHSGGPELELYGQGDMSSKDYISYYLVPIKDKA